MGPSIKSLGVAAGTGLLGALLFGLPGSSVARVDESAAACVPDRVDLGTLRGHIGSGVNAVNDEGEAVGYSYRADGTGRAVLWSGSSTPTRLRLPVDREIGYAGAVDINDRGVIAVYIGDGDISVQSYLWRDGRLQPLNVGERLDSSWVAALNDHGTAVGSGVNGIEWTPVAWSHGKAHVLPLPKRFEYGRASDVNNRGVIVGEARRERRAGWVGRPWAWWPSGRTGRLALPERFRGATFIVATSVDDDGRIYGYVPERGRILVWTDRGREVHALPKVDPQTHSVVWGSDDSGTIVGRLTPQWDGEQGPLLQRSNRDSLPRTLLPLTGDAGDFGRADAVVHGINPFAPAGGTTVAGSSMSASGLVHATIWTCAWRQSVPRPTTTSTPSRAHSRQQQEPARSHCRPGRDQLTKMT